MARRNRTGTRWAAGLAVLLLGLVPAPASMPAVPVPPVGDTVVAAAAPTGTVTTFGDSFVRDVRDSVLGPDGNVWFTNDGGNSIGTMNPAGMFTLHTSPAMSSPWGIASGPDGNLWFTNRRGNSIGRITPAGVVTTFTDASIKNPEGITAGADGNLWFVNPDAAGSTVGRITPAGVVTSFGGVGKHPTSIVSGPEGDLWIASTACFNTVCSGVASITRVTTAGAATPVATSGTPAGFTGAADLAVDGSSTVWFTEGTTVGRITSSGVLSTFTAAAITDAGSIVLGSDGNLWFAAGAGTIGRVTPAGVVTTFDDTTGTRAVGLAADPAGKVWFAHNGGCRATAVCDVASIGSITTAGVVSTQVDGSSIATPDAIAIGLDGNLWFTNRGSDSIGRITPAGVVTSFTDPSIKDPRGIVAGADGNLWFTNSGNDTIGRITHDGVVTPFGGTGIAEPRGIVSGLDGALWFTNYAGNSIGRITTTGVVSEHADPSIDHPVDIALGPDGNLWFVNIASVGRMTHAGVVTDLAAPVFEPTAIAGGPDGKLWVTVPAGQFSTVVRVTTAGLPTPFSVTRDPQGIAPGPDGSLWVTDPAITPDAADAIGRLTPTGGYTSFRDPGISRPTGIVAGPDGGLWFTNRDANTIGRIQPSIPQVFSDVPIGHPFFDEIGWMASTGISTGFPDGTFRPTVAVSRQAMASFLYKFAGQPPVTLVEPFFADVPPSHQFFTAIQWMAQESLSTGTPQPGGKPLYKPTDPVSRQAMAAFLWRDAGEPAPTLVDPFFADVTAANQFFIPVQWMAESGLSKGTPNPPGAPLYKPTTPVSRQAMAAFLQRFDALG